MAASVTVYVNINEGGVTAKLNEIDALIDKLNAKKVNINVQSAASQTVTSLNSMANGFSNATMQADLAGAKITGDVKLVSGTVKELNDVITESSRRYKTDTGQIIDVAEKNGKKLRKISTDYEFIEKEQEKAQKEQQKIEAESIKSNERRLKNEERIRKENEKNAAAQEKAEKAEQEAVKKTSAFWTGVKATAIAAGTALFIKSTKEALNTMKDVDSELANIRKVTGESAESINQLGKEAYDTASKYGVSATEYLESAANFAKAGYSNYANLAELAIKTQLVGDVSAETASKFLLSADAAYKFGGNIDQLSTVLDRANVIENNYATSIDKLAEGFPIVASTASMANMSVDELMAALGTITHVTQETGRKAATALRALILNIEGEIGTVIDEDMTITQESVESMADALKKYGNEAVKAAQKTGKLVDPMEAIKSLAEAYKNNDLDDQGLYDILSSLGGKLRTNQLTALVKNFDIYSEMLEQVKVSAGSADAELSIMQETWERRTEKLKNSWTDLVSDVINTDAIKNAIDVTTSAINGLDRAIETLTTTQKDKAKDALDSVSKEYENLYGDKGTAAQEIAYLQSKQETLSTFEQNRLAYLMAYEAQLSKAVKEATDRDIEQRQKYLEEVERTNWVNPTANMLDLFVNRKSRMTTALEGLTSDKAAVYNGGEAGSKNWQETASAMSEVIAKYADMYTYISDLKADGGQISEEAARFMLTYEEAVREYSEAAANATEETQNLAAAAAELASAQEDTAISFEDTTTSIGSAITALSEYSDAMKAAKGTAASGYTSVYDAFLKDWKAGMTDSTAINEAAKMLLSPEMRRELGYNMEAMGEFLSGELFQGIFNGPSDNAGANLANYLYDNLGNIPGLSEITKFSIDENGNLDFAYASVEKLASALNISLPLMQALLDAVDVYGAEAELGWEGTQNLADSLQKLGVESGEAGMQLQDVVSGLDTLFQGQLSAEQLSSYVTALGKQGFIEGFENIDLAELGTIIDNVLKGIQPTPTEEVGIEVDQAQASEAISDATDGTTIEATVELKDSGDNGIEDKEVTVSATTEGTEQLQEMANTEGEIKTKDETVTVNAVDNGLTEMAGVYNSLQSKTVVVEFKATGILPKYAEGTKDAPGGPALVNEKGPELISDNGRAYIANGGKPAIVSLGKGAIVLTAEETRQAIGNISVNNGINAYASGIPRISSGSGGGGGGSTKTEREKATRSTSTAKEKDPWKELESELKDALSDYNDIAEWYHNQRKHDEEADVYLDAIARINEARDKYLEAGFKEDSAEVAKLANKIYDYQEKIREAHQHAIDDLEKELDLIDEQIDLAENQGDYQKALELQGLAQDKVAKLLEEYRAAGYSDTSEEILKLANKGYGYASKSDSQIKDLWKDLIDSLKAMQSTQEDANDLAEKQLAVDEAREALTNAQNQRTVRVFNPVTGQWEWIANAKDIASAEEKLQKAEESLLKEQQSQELDALKKLYEQNGKLSDITIGPGLSALIGNASIDDMNAFATALGLLSGGLTTTADTSAKSIFDSVDSHDTVTQYTFNGVTIDAGTAQNTSLADLVAMISPLAITTNMPA